MNYDLERIAAWASLHLKEEDKESLKADFDELLRFTAILDRYPPNEEVTSVPHGLRDDEVRPSFDRAELLLRAAHQDGKYFTVNTVISEEAP